MLTYLIRRFLLFFPTLIGATALIFFVVELSPVSVVDTILAKDGNLQPGEAAARKAYLEKRYGLGKSAPVRYLRWLNSISPIGVKDAGTGFPGPLPVGLKWPDLGNSYTVDRPVTALIGERLPTTLLMQSIALPLAYTIAIFTGIWAARHRGKWQDVASGTLFLGLWSIPVIWTSVMMIGFFANRYYFHWFPTGELHDSQAGGWSFFPGGGSRGYLLDTLWHLALPVLCLTYANFAYISKLTRSALLETLGADFVRTARAKGLAERVVLFRHAFRNSLIPLITVLAQLLSALVVGSVVVERVFSIDGMGKLVVDAIFNKDSELFLSTAAMTILLVMLGNLIADVSYVIADPRVSYER
jgi:ABC-type dipeptide/oligopeptide/nickel transport system permease component